MWNLQLASLRVSTERSDIGAPAMVFVPSQPELYLGTMEKASYGTTTSKSIWTLTRIDLFRTSLGFKNHPGTLLVS
jgi:hypothetical protein